MKILHTADIHLREDKNERWDALCNIAELGTRENIDIMMISGDLFDGNVDAAKLKVRIRELLSNLDYRIFILPGNHDSKSFEDGSFLGSNVELIHSIEDIHELDDIRIAGLPFEETGVSEIYERLNHISSRLDSSKCNILLYHGELLDSFYSRGDFGDEGENRYMPSRLDYFRDMNFDYVLSGHFHTNFNVWEFDKKRYFTYPGSPVSITRRETGKRRVNIFKIGQPPGEVLLNTPFYEEITIKLDPFSDIDPVTAINQELDKADNNATILLNIDGYINRLKHGIDETTLKESLEKIKKDRGNIIEKRFDPIDWSTVLEDEIFKTFLTKLNLKDYSDAKKDSIKELFLKAMQNSEL